MGLAGVLPSIGDVVRLKKRSVFLTIAPPIRPVDRNHNTPQGEIFLRSTQYGRLAGHGYRAFTTAGLCALLATALSLTACGGNDDDTQPGPATSVEASANEQAVATERAVTQLTKSTKAYASKTSPALPDLPNGVPREGTQKLRHRRALLQGQHQQHQRLRGARAGQPARVLRVARVHHRSRRRGQERLRQPQDVGAGFRPDLSVGLWAQQRLAEAVRRSLRAAQVGEGCRQYDEPHPHAALRHAALCNPDFAAPGTCTPGTGEATLRAEVLAPGFFPSTT